MTETLVIKVYDLVRTEALAATVPVEKGKQVVVAVQQVAPSLTISAAPTISLR